MGYSTGMIPFLYMRGQDKMKLEIQKLWITFNTKGVITHAHLYFLFVDKEMNLILLKEEYIFFHLNKKYYSPTEKIVFC